MSNPATEIPVQQLRKAFELVVRHIEGTAGQLLAINNDAFWSVPGASRYDIYSEPGELTIGSVSESWGNLQEMIDDEERVVGYGLVWLADVLRAIGDETAL